MRSGRGILTKAKEDLVTKGTVLIRHEIEK